MTELVTVASDTSGPNYGLIYVLFIIAGLLCGGVWSAYQARNKRATYALALLAGVTLAAAVLWLIGEMT